MRRHLLVAGVVLVGICGLFAAEKDSQLAANTRAKKLTAKVTVDFKDEMLDECVKEVSRQLEDAGAGSLSAAYDTGVSKNQRVTFAAKDQTVADVLDGMFKKNGLGYVVVSKDKDRYDGWIRITRGDERGWPKGQEPKDRATAKAAPKAEPKDAPADKPAAADDPAATEKTAASKLGFARSLLKDGKKDKAKQRFQDIVTQYPTTKAAEEAKAELEKLGG
jgi:TolA-binding protein